MDGNNKKIDTFDKYFKFGRNILWIVSICYIGFVQYLGPGIVEKLKTTLGFNDLYQHVTDGFERIDNRLDFIEENMSPPKILNWLYYRSLGDCNSDSCRVLHAFSKTEYGAQCGQPVVTTKILLEGQIDPIPLQSIFEPINASRNIESVVHDFQINEMFIEEGQHKYQFTLIYPTCEWEREPLPRYSPWFNLVVGESVE